MDKDHLFEDNCTHQSDKIRISSTISISDSDKQKVKRISIHTPKFNKEKPAAWFYQMEAQFACNGITKDLTKYYHALQSLDSNIVSEVSELNMNPPQHRKYEAMKSLVMSEFRDSEEKRLRALLKQRGTRGSASFTFFKVHERS